MIPKFSLLLLFIIIFLNNKGTTQIVAADSFSIQTLKEKAVEKYYNYMKSQLKVLNGWEYKDYHRLITGDQFFLTDEPVNGSVLYDGILYPDLQLRYDIVNDVVVIRHPSQEGYISDVQIPGDKISRFTIPEHNFIRINSDSLSETNIPTGFYDQIYNGTVQVLVKRMKRLVESAGSSEIQKEFVYKERFYIYRNNEYHQIRGRRSFLKLFPERKKEIKRFLKKNNLRFNYDKEKAILKATQYFDQLNYQACIVTD